MTWRQKAAAAYMQGGSVASNPAVKALPYAGLFTGKGNQNANKFMYTSALGGYTGVSRLKPDVEDGVYREIPIDKDAWQAYMYGSDWPKRRAQIQQYAEWHYPEIAGSLRNTAPVKLSLYSKPPDKETMTNRHISPAYNAWHRAVRMDTRTYTDKGAGASYVNGMPNTDKESDPLYTLGHELTHARTMPAEGAADQLRKSTTRAYGDKRVLTYPDYNPYEQFSMNAGLQQDIRRRMKQPAVRIDSRGNAWPWSSKAFDTYLNKFPYYTKGKLLERDKWDEWISDKVNKQELNDEAARWHNMRYNTLERGAKDIQDNFIRNTLKTLPLSGVQIKTNQTVA
jgi:hypothetical protein